MQFKKDVKVVDPSGNSIGNVARVVVDPRNGTVTHLVIGKGWFNADKVIPVDLVQRSSDEAVVLKIDKDQVNDQPDFAETHYVRMDQSEIERTGYGMEGAQPIYWYPVVGVGGGGAYWASGAAPAVYSYPVEQTLNIPEGTIALKEGATVISSDGESVGGVEKVLTESKENRITGLVITKGTLTKQRKIIPANWIDSIKDDGVKLAVTSKFVEGLREYKA